MFSGPSKDVVLTRARGLASTIMQLQTLNSFDRQAKQQIVDELRAKGEPTSMQQLLPLAARVVAEQKMGWLRRNQFLGAIEANLMMMGVDRSYARYMKNMIEGIVKLAPTY
jgi:hypothetical protein